MSNSKRKRKKKTTPREVLRQKFGNDENSTVTYRTGNPPENALYDMSDNSRFGIEEKLYPSIMYDHPLYTLTNGFSIVSPKRT